MTSGVWTGDGQASGPIQERETAYQRRLPGTGAEAPTFQAMRGSAVPSNKSEFHIVNPVLRAQTEEPGRGVERGRDCEFPGTSDADRARPVHRRQLLGLRGLA
jgi:hypothetical protein